MRILLANNFVRHGGGVDAVVELERACLSGAGHEVIEFRVDNNDFDEAPLRARIGKLLSTLYSVPARRRMRRLLEAHEIDIVHVHNTVPFLTGAIYDACRRIRGVKVVASLHNLRALCLSSYGFRDGRPCRECFAHGPLKCVVHGCYRGSRIQSLGLAAARGVDRLLGRRFGMDADAYIAVSDYIRDVHRVGGLRGRPIHVLRNAVADPLEEQGADRTSDVSPVQKLVYVGALLESKGVRALCSLAQQLPEFEFHVVGEGEDRARLERISRDLELRNFTLHGYVKDLAHGPIWHDALFTLMPAKGPEAAPIVALESLALGVPILASAVGGLPECVRHGETGYLVDFADTGAVAERVRRFWRDASGHAAMRSNARRLFEAEYSARDYAGRLLKVFEEVLQPRGTRLRSL